MWALSKFLLARIVHYHVYVSCVLISMRRKHASLIATVVTQYSSRLPSGQLEERYVVTEGKMRKL